MMDIAPDATVGEVVRRHPSTGLILLQQGRLFRVRPGSLYPDYVPPLTLREFATINGVELIPLLARLRRAADEDPADSRGYDVPERRAPPSGALGYTGGYREPGPADAEAMSMTAALARRGPD